MKISLIIAMLFAYTVGVAQMERYDGEFQNAQHEPGTATYSYYIQSKTGKKIKHGAFRYRVKIKTPKMRVYRTVTGEYKSGWKDSLWNYSFTTKDYDAKHDGYLYTYDVELAANYDMGWPNGEWYYTALVKRRKKVEKNGEMVWIAYEIMKDMRMKVNYSHGKLLDSIWMKDRDVHFDAFMDKNGFMLGDFELITDSSEVKILFKKGFVVKSNNPENDIVVQDLHYNYWMEHKDNLAAFGANLDTNALTFYKSIFMNNIYNDLFFNYRFIDGDQIVKFVGARKKMEVNHWGMYKRQLKVYVTEEDLLSVQRIYGFHIKAKRQLDACAKKYKSSENDPKLRQKLDQLKALEKMFKAYTCQAKMYRTYVTPKEIALKANSCGSDLKISESNSRKQILSDIYNQAKNLNKKLILIKCE